MSLDPKSFRAQVRRDRAAGRIARYRARTVLSVCDLAERHGQHLPNMSRTETFMGLGPLGNLLDGGL